MTRTPIDIDVRDDRDTSRFPVDQGGSTAKLTYRTEVRLILARTAVPLSLEGRGVGGELVGAAVTRARTQHLTLVPAGPFACRWLRDHPEATEGVMIDWTQPRHRSRAPALIGAAVGNPFPRDEGRSRLPTPARLLAPTSEGHLGPLCGN